MRVGPVWLLAVVLAFTLTVLTSLGHASPPDPTWIAGLYDDGDHDDVVLEVVGMVAAPAAEPPQALAPISAGPVLSAVVREVPAFRSIIARLDRAPPLA
jgi:hypothetical protein